MGRDRAGDGPCLSTLVYQYSPVYPPALARNLTHNTLVGPHPSKNPPPPLFPTQGVKHSWNRNYPNAHRVFNSSVLLSGVRSQHSSLYATQLGTSRAGVLQVGACLGLGG